VRKREDHDLVGPDLIDEGEGETIQRSDPTIGSVSPLRRRPGKLKDRFENCFDLVFQFGAETGAARLVAVDLVIDLGDREPMDSKLQRFARTARRWRTCA
jgi:hypothetical protein